MNQTQLEQLFAESVLVQAKAHDALASATAQAIGLALLALAKQMDVHQLVSDTTGLLAYAKDAGTMPPLTLSIFEEALEGIQGAAEKVAALKSKH